MMRRMKILKMYAIRYNSIANTTQSFFIPDCSIQLAVLIKITSYLISVLAAILNL